MNPDSLRIGVVGAGVFGNYHAAKCQAHPRHDFIGIYDTDHERVRDAAIRHRTRGFGNCNALMSGVDALIVASPAQYHGAVALAALKAGRHVLVEKPMATKLEQAKEMIALAADQDLVLQVDHQERFVAKAIGLDKVPEKPLSIHATRFGTKTARGTDVSVTLDLMTHDLDMVLWLMGEKPLHTLGESMCIYSDNPDVARADLHFAGGAHVHLEASRAEEARERVMQIVYPSGTLSIDFINKRLDNNTPFDLDERFASNPMASDSLGASVDAFTASVLDGAPVVIPGQAGMNAVEQALIIDGGQ